ncbi:MAG: acyl-CoA reductase [Chthoniobacteraceae bacterium]
MSKHTDILDEYHALEARVFVSLHDFLEDEFDALALDIHAFQRRRNAPFARWCHTLPEPTTWREIPAVPQAMFKQFRLSCFPAKLAPVTFRTSGTTGEARGEHHFADTALYEASILAGWQRLRRPKLPALFLAQRPDEVPDSSLTHMFGVLAGRATGRSKFDMRADADALRKLASRGPCAVFGTALAFLALFERMGDARVRLPRGSFAFETGGYKGSGRDIPKAELYAKFLTHLGLSADSVWNEYGMTELSSQAYTSGLARPHSAPPWLRALVINPETGKEVAVGEAGVLRLFDLANVGSVLAIQTADLAVRRNDGLELLGRDPAAVPRGCSRRADEILTGASNAGPTRIVVQTPAAKATEPHAELQKAARERRRALPLPDTAARAHALAKAAEKFPFLGKFIARGLLSLVASELGHAAVLDGFVKQGRRHVRAIAPPRILHVLSGNTPAAALQSLLRGLLLGSENFCKLPSAGIAEVGDFVSRLPRALAQRVQLSHELPESWLNTADAAVLFGRDETVAALRAMLPPGIPVLARGHRLSLAMVSEDPHFRSLNGAARDVATFDQQGCLSPHTIFVKEHGTLTAAGYAQRLAHALARFEKHTPRGPVTLSEANTIGSLREETAFRAANGEPVALLASTGTAWTVIVDRTDRMPLSPGNRVVFVKPLGHDFSTLFAPHRTHLSTCGIWPVNAANRELAAALGFTRICPIGKMQSPPLDWHHDGQPVLAPLVRWVDCEK